VRLDRGLIGLLLRMSRGSIRPLLGLYGRLETAARQAGIEGDLDLARVRKFGLLELPKDSAADTAESHEEGAETAKLRAAS